MTFPVTRIDPHTFGPWALVTGASSGIGKEFARQLAASGFHVVLVARRLSTLEELGGRLATEFGVQYRAVAVDLTEEHFLNKLEEATHDLDIGLVVSNAGTWMLGDFLTIDERTLQRSLRLNVQAHLDVAHHFGQHLAQRRRGGLLLTASTAGLQGIPFSAEYAAAKAYVLTLGEGLHGEWQKVDVHVTVLLPGATDTPMLEATGFERPCIASPKSSSVGPPSSFSPWPPVKLPRGYKDADDLWLSSPLMRSTPDKKKRVVRQRKEICRTRSPVA
jgi:short-subunit dehydrogenase